MNYTLTPSLNRAHKAEAIKAHLNRYADHYMLATCGVALAFLAGLLLGEARENALLKERLDYAYSQGSKFGEEVAINANKPTVEGCMAFWFSGDTKRVSKAIKKIKLEN